MGETYRGIAVVSVWVLTTLIAALGAVAGVRALTDWVSGADEGVGETAAAEETAPRPPTTEPGPIVLAPPRSTTTVAPTLPPIPSTTLFVPEILLPDPPPPTSAPPPPPPAPPPTAPPPVVPSTTLPVVTSTLPPTTATTTTSPPVDQVLTYDLTGGSIQVTANPTSVVLDTAVPKEGFSAIVHGTGPSTVNVRFSSAAHVSLISVRLVRGEVVASVEENSLG